MENVLRCGFEEKNTQEDIFLFPVVRHCLAPPLSWHIKCDSAKTAARGIFRDSLANLCTEGHYMRAYDPPCNGMVSEFSPTCLFHTGHLCFCIPLAFNNHMFSAKLGTRPPTTTLTVCLEILTVWL